MDEKTLEEIPSDDGRFKFVNFTTPEGMRSQSSLQTIRKHAMKEIGKSRRSRRSRRLEIVLDVSELQRQYSSFAGKSPSSWWLGAGPMDPFIKYPIDLGQDERELVAIIFDHNISTQKSLRDAWFGVGLDDSGTFLQVLANSALHMDSIRNGGREPRENPISLHYQTLAIKSITSKGENFGEPPTDQMMGTVTGLICYYVIIGDFRRWSIHMRGLISMLQSRGGISGIAHNEKLQITASWVEILGACGHDLEPVFPQPAPWLQCSKPTPRTDDNESVSEMVSRWTSCIPNHSDWISIYHDLFIFSRQTSIGADNSLINSPYSGAWTNSMIHQLLSIRPLRNGNGREELIEEVCRIASLLFLVPLWRKFGVFTVRSAYLLSELRLNLSNPRIHWKGVESFHLWVLYIGCIQAEGDDLEWFVQFTESWMLQYGIQSWDALKDQVKAVLWVEHVFRDLKITPNPV